MIISMYLFSYFNYVWAIYCLFYSTTIVMYMFDIIFCYHSIYYFIYSNSGAVYYSIFYYFGFVTDFYYCITPIIQ